MVANVITSLTKSTNVRLELKIGNKETRPVPAHVVAAIESLEIRQGDDGPSSWQIVFKIGRISREDVSDFSLFRDETIKLFNRIVMILHLYSETKVLMDGLITQIQMQPSDEPGASRLTVSGEDIGVHMDFEEKQRSFHDKTLKSIISEIVSEYSWADIDLDSADKNLLESQPDPVLNQNKTDRAFLAEQANSNGYVFFIRPTDTEKNKVYWGKRLRLSGQHQTIPLSCQFGAFSNVETISFSYGGMQAFTMSGEILERDGQTTVINPKESNALTFTPTLANEVAIRKTKLLRRTNEMSVEKARAALQAEIDNAAANIVTASGTLDTSRYGAVLEAGVIVAVRGVGKTFNGKYYVKSVTHSIKSGSYKQQFTLERDGVISCINNINEMSCL